jgi:hypothetical protein
MLDAAVLRAQQEFLLQPQLQGEVLSAIGHIYMRCNEPERSKRTLSQALRLLSSAAPSSDVTLNRTRAQLAAVALTKRILQADAVIKLDLGHYEAAREQLASSSVGCSMQLRAVAQLFQPRQPNRENLGDSSA